MRWIRSANGPSSWSTTTRVAPASVRVARVSAIASWLARSTPAFGSSRTSSSGCPASVRAISTRCCCPPESVETWWRARSARPTASRASLIATRSLRRIGAQRPAARESTGGHHLGDGRGHALGDRRALRHVAEAVPVAEAGQLLPKSRMLPLLSGCSPTIALTSVDLPEPLAPSSATTSPGCDRRGRCRARSVDRRGPHRRARDRDDAARSCAASCLLDRGQVAAHQRKVVGLAGPMTTIPRSGRAPGC